jgi:hypothetical protein
MPISLPERGSLTQIEYEALLRRLRTTYIEHLYTVVNPDGAGNNVVDMHFTGTPHSDEEDYIRGFRLYGRPPGGDWRFLRNQPDVFVSGYLHSPTVIRYEFIGTKNMFHADHEIETTYVTTAGGSVGNIQPFSGHYDLINNSTINLLSGCAWAVNFAEPSGVRVDSVSGYTWTDNNTVIRFPDPTIVEWSADFVASDDDYLSADIPSDASGIYQIATDDVTIFALVDIDSAIDSRRILTKWAPSTNQRSYVLEFHFDPSGFRWNMSGDNVEHFFIDWSGDLTPLDTWHGVTVTHQNGVDASIRVGRDTPVTEAYTSGVALNDQIVEIGGFLDGGGGGAQMFDGQIETIIWWNRLLFDEEHDALINNEKYVEFPFLPENLPESY